MTRPRGFLVYKERCDQCLFGPNRIVSSKRMKEVLDDCREKQHYFICHKSTLEGTNDVCCRGFFDTYPGATTAMRFAQVAGLVFFLPLPDLCDELPLAPYDDLVPDD